MHLFSSDPTSDLDHFFEPSKLNKTKKLPCPMKPISNFKAVLRFDTVAIPCVGVSSQGDSVQQLFGGVEPSSKMLADHYKEQPELAAYLTARSLAHRDSHN